MSKRTLETKHKGPEINIRQNLRSYSIKRKKITERGIFL